MIKRTLSLNTIDRVKKFVSIAANFKDDLDLAAGRYVIDGKSIMGIFSLNLFDPLELTIHAEEDEAKEFLEAIDEFVVA